LIILQFTISVVLIKGTVIVYQQIQHGQTRPIGYNNKGIISLEMNDPGYKGKQEALRSEFLNSGVVSSVAFSSNPLTAIWSTMGGYTWEGENPNTNSYFRICDVTHDYGKTAGWQIVSGRDFNSDVLTDSTHAVIINEAAVRYIGFEDPVGRELVALNEFDIPQQSWIIIGVVKDMVMESPYEQVKQTLYYVNENASNIMHIRFTPEAAMSEALPMIKASLEKIVPVAIFDYTFVDEEYARKFSQEQRIGNLSAIFATLAIVISCLGLFGLASYVSEQRTKEIGIRKVLGATVSNLWSMLARDFIVLVIIGCIIAFPIGYFLMHSWLEKYEYRTEISGWTFLATSIAALVITLLTVSYQSIKVATMNPVKSLRSE
jgi:putative ABC transport system permease protein